MSADKIFWTLIGLQNEHSIKSSNFLIMAQRSSRYALPPRCFGHSYEA
jgi:hypothetical protein